MIFSSLFKSKNNWQSKQSATRISAIQNELSCNEPAQKQVLCDLYTNDESELVRKAALIKLNSFDDYLNAYNHNSLKKIKEFAKKQLLLVLHNEHEIKLSSDEKLTFIQSNEVLTISELESWLALEQSSDVVFTLFDLIKEKKQQQGKSYQQFVVNVFTHHQNEKIQKTLVDECDDATILEKLLKKSSIDIISQVINDKLFAQQQAKEKPIKIKKQVNLILSKLLALKDIVSYETYLAKKAELEAQWQSAQVDFNYLLTADQELLNEKFEGINKQLAKIFTAKAENYQQEQIAKQLSDQKHQASKMFNEQLVSLNKAITKAVFESQEFNQQVFRDSLDQIQKDIHSSVLNKQEQSALLNELNLIHEKLTKLPEIAESVTKATHLISKMSQLALPSDIIELNEKQNLFSKWLAEWRQVENMSSGILPESILEAYQEINNSWKSTLLPLQNEQKQIFSQVRKKLLDVKRLLSQGKYKVCFGLFKGVNKQYVLLSEKQQAQLQRDYSQVSEKISELNDWEHYIATPRKQELLEQIQSLVDSPLDNPNDQAAKVKAFRKQWNLLGHADEAIDHQLNEQFNEACEQAFGPCRLFYAEQEKVRALHLTKREDILQQARALAQNTNTEKNQEIDFKELDAQVNKLQQHWSDAGEVDRSVYRPLNDEFKQLIQPLKAIIKEFHLKNMTEKKQLIDKAEKETSNENVFQAIENVKQYQKQWRNIGFSGAHNENKLWQQFRKVNDVIFAKRDEVKAEQQQVQIQLEEELFQKLNELQSQFNKGNAEPLSVLKSLKVETLALHEDVLSNKPVLKSVLKQVDDFLTLLNETEQEINIKADKQNWQSLFGLLKAFINKEFSPNQLDEQQGFADLLPIWQKRLSECLVQSKGVEAKQRETKTLEIEVLAQIDSPQEYQNERMAVQVQLMQQQMQSGGSINLPKDFAQWLQLGQLTVDELPLLSRLEPVFCH
ncbi:DUF349 domain-containing protein [Litorilituus lipolyticus]|uniref:DUF349 domain-containing protein n=1 Tax=Litorilituus lipolyticus TaxID=2491017 RepID=A0A502KMI6_9GAMM|nr:DUF349 domain-containing protein [Litorilituus lipolyticus]TPH12812.1 DUF349 domain-containing protein [Litorilituus lipolyticus]